MSPDTLKPIFLFKDLKSEELQRISQISELEVYQSGDEIFSQGDKPVAMFVIKYGSIKIFQTSTDGAPPVAVATLATGSHFGEMGLIDGGVRSASAQAMEKTELFRIEYEKIRKVIEENPSTAVRFYKAIAQYLCGRLRATTIDLGFAREVHLKHF